LGVVTAHCGLDLDPLDGRQGCLFRAVRQVAYSWRANSRLLEQFFNLLGNLRRTHRNVLGIELLKRGAGLRGIAPFPSLQLSLKTVGALLKGGFLRFLRRRAGAGPQQVRQQSHIQSAQHRCRDHKSLPGGLQIAHQIPSLLLDRTGWGEGAVLAGRYSPWILNFTLGVPAFASFGCVTSSRILEVRNRSEASIRCNSSRALFLFSASITRFSTSRWSGVSSGWTETRLARLGMIFCRSLSNWVQENFRWAIWLFQKRFCSVRSRFSGRFSMSISRARSLSSWAISCCNSLTWRFDRADLE